MTLIIGVVCSDGVIIASDSKMVSAEKQPTYDNQKIFQVGKRAIAFGGTAAFSVTSNAIVGSVEYLIRSNPKVTIREIADKVCEQATNFLKISGTKYSIIVADSSCLYIIQVPPGTIEESDSTMMGVKDVMLLPPIKENTTKAYKGHLKKTIELNVGRTVGGPTQIVILKK